MCEKAWDGTLHIPIPFKSSTHWFFDKQRCSKPLGCEWNGLAVIVVLFNKHIPC